MEHLSPERNVLECSGMLSPGLTEDGSLGQRGSRDNSQCGLLVCVCVCVYITPAALNTTKSTFEEHSPPPTHAFD